MQQVDGMKVSVLTRGGLTDKSVEMNLEQTTHAAMYG